MLDWRPWILPGGGKFCYKGRQTGALQLVYNQLMGNKDRLGFSEAHRAKQSSLFLVRSQGKWLRLELGCKYSGTCETHLVSSVTSGRSGYIELGDLPEVSSVIQYDGNLQKSIERSSPLHKPLGAVVSSPSVSRWGKFLEKHFLCKYFGETPRNDVRGPFLSNVCSSLQRRVNDLPSVVLCFSSKRLTSSREEQFLLVAKRARTAPLHLSHFIPPHSARLLVAGKNPRLSLSHLRRRLSPPGPSVLLTDTFLHLSQSL